MAAFAKKSSAPTPSAADFTNKPPLDQAAEALRRANLASHPVLQPSQSFPKPKPNGLAAKRLRPALNLASIDPNFVLEHSAPVAGLGQGRPQLSLKKPAVNFSTPFANFSKIV